MALTLLSPSDFAPWGTPQDAKLTALITDVQAKAAIVAPCLSLVDFKYPDAAKAILREAVLRRLEAGSGAVATKFVATGPFSTSETFDTRSLRGILQPKDIAELQELCKLNSGAASSPRFRGASMDPNESAEYATLNTRPDLIFQTNVDPAW